VALGIESCPEYHAPAVNQLYGQYLQRLADPIGLAAGSAFFAGGGTIDQLRAFLLGQMVDGSLRHASLAFRKQLLQLL
jgi:hypothetical protein